MPRSKEIQEQIRTKIVNMYQSGKGYTAISKALGLQRTTVRSIIYKWRKLGTVVNLPRSGWTTKITPRAQWQLIQEFIKEPRTTPKEPQASLASIKVSVHDSTIRKRLGKNSLHGRKVHNGSPHICHKISWLSPDIWANTLWTDETKFELLCVPLHQHRISWKEHNTTVKQVVVWWV